MAMAASTALAPTIQKAHAVEAGSAVGLRRTTTRAIPFNGIVTPAAQRAIRASLSDASSSRARRASASHPRSGYIAVRSLLQSAEGESLPPESAIGADY